MGSAAPMLSATGRAKAPKWQGMPILWTLYFGLTLQRPILTIERSAAKWPRSLPSRLNMEIFLPLTKLT